MLYISFDAQKEIINYKMKMIKTQQTKKIIIRLMGGLGNQLFQYALAKKIEVINGKLGTNTKIVLDSSSYRIDRKRKCELDKFNISIPIKKYTILDVVYKLCNRIDKFPSWITRDYGAVFDLEKHIMKETKCSYLIGFWHNTEYIEDIRALLKDEFCLCDSVSRTPKYQMLVDEICDNNAVAIHVRRGDYLTNGNEDRYVLQGVEYYKRAINKLSSEINSPVFFIFSDDLDWCKKEFAQLTDAKLKYVEDFDNDNDLLQFELMRKCKHFIIGNSTYSWWASWLAENSEAIKIAPVDWYFDKDKNQRIGTQLLTEYIRC